jgi:ABC-2 type transport system ATP-binding protein
LLTTHYMEEADVLCDRLALMHLGRIRALGSPDELKAELGPEASLEDVFRRYTGNSLEEEGEGKGGMRAIRTTRRTAGRVG